MVLGENERIDDLQIKGMKLLQNTKGFCFGVDAVLLSDFAEVKKGERVIDLCTGNGIVPVLLHAKYEPSFVAGMEIQDYAASLAMRNMELNALSVKSQIVCGNLKEADKHFERASFDVLTCNPPYKRAMSGLINKEEANNIARHEIEMTLKDLIESAMYLLKDNGRFYMIHRPDRLADILCEMRAARLEPKTLRFVHPKPAKAPNMVLVEGRKYGGNNLKILPPLYVYDDSGEYSQEINEIYGRDSI